MVRAVESTRSPRWRSSLARNRVVLEVVQGHNARFERIEARLDETQSMIVEILDIVRGRAR